MRHNLSVSLILSLLPLSGCATTTNAPESTGPKPTPEQIVAARRAAFTLTQATFGAMRRTIEAGGEVKPMSMGARGLAGWAEALPAMFPEGTQLPGSRARPEIWRDRADFDAQVGAFRSATAALLAAAEAGDATAFKSALEAVGAACSACHSSYRAEAAR